MCCSVCFFFQAEDGIRDLVRSRGLGDVYKRQTINRIIETGRIVWIQTTTVFSVGRLCVFIIAFTPVSYTHLTLPTSDLV